MDRQPPHQIETVEDGAENLPILLAMNQPEQPIDRVQEGSLQWLEISAAEERIETLSREFARVVRGLYEQAVREAREAPSPPPASSPPNTVISLFQQEPGRDPLNVLPELAWREVLGKLTELSDLYNCWRTCHLFRKILRPRESEIKTYVNLRSQWFTAHFHEWDMRNILDEFPTAVHQFFRNHPSMRPFDGVRQGLVQHFGFVNPLRHYDWIATYDFRKDGIYSQIVPPALGPVRYTDGTPFLGEQLYLSLLMNGYDGAPEDDQLWRIVRDFLQTYGAHVKYLTAALEPRPRPSYANHAIPFLLDQLATFLPNLKRLAVNLCFCVLQTPAGVFPLATALPSLETLEIRCAFRYPESCANCLLSPVIQILITTYNSQLGKLHVSASVWSRIASHVNWPHLKELSLDTVTDTFNFASLQLCEDLAMLEKMTIEGDITTVAAVEECLGVLRRIINNSKSFSTLALGGVWLDRLPWSLNIATIFPLKLRTLILNLENCNIYSYMFLLSRFTFVENIQVYLGEHRSLVNQSAGSIIRNVRDAAADRYFGGLQHYDSDRILHLNRLMHRGELYSCNLWRWLPRLQVFSYQFKVFTREQYNKTTLR